MLGQFRAVEIEARGNRGDSAMLGWHGEVAFVPRVGTTRQDAEIERAWRRSTTRYTEMKGNCEELAQDIEALVAETTGLSSKAAEHVQSCRICREKIEGLRAIAAIHWDAASNMPEPKRRLSRQQLESALAEGGSPMKYLGVHWRPVLAGVVALALIVGGALTHQTMRERASAQHQS